MRFQRLQLYCSECGCRAPVQIKRVGFTPHHQLVIHFQCLRCRRDLYVVKNLADCWRECPKPGDELEGFEASIAAIEPYDAQFRMAWEWPCRSKDGS